MNPSLPNDAIIQILARLPIKSLFRFKSVCKSWCHLPSDPHFASLHHEISSQNPNLLLELLDLTKPSSTFISIDSCFAVSKFSLDFLNDSVKIRSSSHGILCCASVRSKGVYYVCNPMTRQFRLLPRTRERPFTRFQPEYEASIVALTFDPVRRSFILFLAGFYRPFGHRPHDELVCLVFDSLSNTWSKFISYVYEEFTHMNRNQVVFFNGALHWLTYSCSYVLALDLGEFVWRKISMPEEVVGSGFAGRIYLLDFEGLVSVIRILGDWMSTWVLRDYVREKWVLEDKVSLGCIRGFATSAFPISQSKDVVFLATQKKVLTYGRRDRVWREIFAVEDNCTYPLWFSAHSFRNSLFPCQ